MDLAQPATRRFVLIMTLFIVVLISFVNSFFSTPSQQMVESAELHLKKGNEAVVLSERGFELNEALNTYLKLESNHSLQTSNGKFYFNVGNTYNQLQAYPWAMLYYSRALALRPRDPKVLRSIERLEKELGLTSSSSNTLLSTPSWLQLFFNMGAVAFLLFSVDLWLPRRGVRRGGYLLLVLTVFFLSFALYQRYFAPIEGVIMEQVVLKDAPYADGVLLAKFPLKEGSRVKVLDSAAKGAWLKVSTREGVVGYLENRKVRII